MGLKENRLNLQHSMICLLKEEVLKLVELTLIEMVPSQKLFLVTLNLKTCKTGMLINLKMPTMIQIKILIKCSLMLMLILKKKMSSQIQIFQIDIARQNLWIQTILNNRKRKLK